MEAVDVYLLISFNFQDLKKTIISLKFNVLVNNLQLRQTNIECVLKLKKCHFKDRQLTKLIAIKIYKESKVGDKLYFLNQIWKKKFTYKGLRCMNKCGYKMCQSRLFASKICISLSQLLLETLSYKKTKSS